MSNSTNIDPGAFVIEVQNCSSGGCWLSDIEGDPGRTMVLSSAKVWKTKVRAFNALLAVRQEYPSRMYQIVPLALAQKHEAESSRLDPAQPASPTEAFMPVTNYPGILLGEATIDLTTGELVEDPAQPAEPTYPCRECGVPRTKAEGGTTFTVCDECWDKGKAQPAENQPVAGGADSLPEYPGWTQGSEITRDAREKLQKMKADLTRLEAERDTYRQALETIVSDDRPESPLTTAKRALAQHGPKTEVRQ